MKPADESAGLQRIRDAYARRTQAYDPLAPWVYLTRQEKERALIRWAKLSGLAPFTDKRLLEIGCGTGGNLLEFLRLGFVPENLTGNELLEQRLTMARRLLPSGVTLLAGDAAGIALKDESFDVVYQSLVCSSMLDDELLGAVAARMWSLARPGGGVLWYDFVYDNPRNPDVRGIPLSRVRQLFPDSRPMVWRVTLAPPISRLVSRVHPSLYGICNAIPTLRTHVLCWFPKNVRTSRGNAN